jgi:hypothetical protein
MTKKEYGLFSLSILSDVKHDNIVSYKQMGSSRLYSDAFQRNERIATKANTINEIKVAIRFIKPGEVVSKMSRRFFIFCTKNKIFCTNFPKRKGCLSGVL